MRLRLFNPEGLKAVDYKAAYPELERTPEFEHMKGSELMFVWYYSNATSPLMEIIDREERVVEALKRSRFNPEPSEYERMLKLQFSEQLEIAIGKMSSYLPGARYLGWKALKAIFDQYQEIASKGTDYFKKTVGTGEDAVDEVDYSAYTNTTTKIVAALPGLIQRMEEGLGISMAGSSEDGDDVHGIHSTWFINRQDR